MMLGEEYSTPGVTYDRVVVDQKFKFRYLTDSGPYVPQTECTLTHCVNIAQIKLCLPCEEEFVYLVADLKQGLRREWYLEARVRNQPKHDPILVAYNSIRDSSWPVLLDSTQITTLPEFMQAETKQFVIENQDVFTDTYHEINAAYESVIWHKEYYERYPFTTDETVTVVDIQNDKSDFAQVMRDELGRYSSEVFDLAWDVATQYGRGAPVLDIFRARFSANS